MLLLQHREHGTALRSEKSHSVRNNRALPLGWPTLPLVTIFHTMAERKEPVAAILTEANWFLIKNLPVGRFVAVAHAMHRLSQSPRASLGGWGMPDVLLVSATRDKLQRFPSEHVALGIDDTESAAFEPMTVSLAEGEQFVLCSDGVVEARNENGEGFGEARFQYTLRNHPAHRRAGAPMRCKLR